MSAMAPPLILIPAAGFGVRVGSPPAKELLRREGTEEPLIELPLRLAQQRGWPALVVTRSEKRSLIDYLTQRHPEAGVHLLEKPTQDWQESLLKAREGWGRTNIVLLPDTEWAPLDILDSMAEALTTNGKEGMNGDGADVVVAQHSVSDPQSWGHLWATQQGMVGVFEKPPSSFYGGPGTAWGLFGFRQEFGEILLQAQWESQKTQSAQCFEGRLQAFPLQHFRDLTRPSGVNPSNSPHQGVLP